MNPLLLQAARGQDRQAIALLLRSLQDTWYHFALGLLNDADEAADATQETALRFLKQLPSFRGESELKTWSLGIALNVCREIRRKRSSTSDPDRLPPMIDPMADPSDAMELADQREQVRAILMYLTDRQREVVILRFFEELSTEQAAAAMDCAPGTIKAMLHQALRALRLSLSASDARAH